MQRLYATAALLMALALITPQDGQAVAASPDATQTPEQTVPQGNDAPGADNGEQSSPATPHKGLITPPKTGDEDSVITPPKTGDEDIFTEVPDPNAGTKEEVIPPPGTPGSKQPNVEPR